MKSCFTLLATILILIQFNPSFAKIEIVKDSRGTDFWLTFLPNYHNNYYANNARLKFGDSLFVFIAAAEPTRGKIEYFDQEGVPYETEFEITDPTKMFIFSVSSYYFELKGFNLSGNITTINDQKIQTEKVALNSFHITSEKEVSVYALNQAVTTSDAFLVLPTDVLGKRYFVLSYFSDGIEFINPFEVNPNTPSQFAIVATEDSTYITIYPKNPSFRNGMKIQQLLLNRGEVYLVQAQISKGNLNSDLTGTEIIASKPIAVFAGHQRATVPVTVRNSVPEPSRDILIEQLPPVSTWGKNSIVVPFAKSKSEITYGNNLYRILAAEDGTDIFVDGKRITTLNQGEYYEGVLDAPHYISSNKPILVGGFKKTCGSGSNFLGDPFFAIMPPIEQYMDEYRVINSQAFEFRMSSYQKVYEEQYISIIIPQVSWQSFRIDGASLALSDIKQVSNSEYVYATIRVSDGVHYLWADTGFGMVIYGYGGANSYGYIGGSNYLILNYLEPQITTLQSDTCFVAKGIAYKNRPKDAAIKSLIVVDSLLINTELSQNKVYSDTIFFSFRLKDIFQDGRFATYAIDTMNLVSQLFVDWIKGFTLSIENKKPGEIVSIIGEAPTGNDFCFNIPIINYGIFNQNISSIYLKNTKIKPKNFLPITLDPKQKVNFQFCFSFANDTTIIDTLIIENECLSLPFGIVQVTFSTDKFPPEILFLNDSCLRNINIVVSDSLSFDKGLKKVEIIEKYNCEVDIINELPRKAIIKLQILDIQKDVSIIISAEDLAGNVTKYEKHIPGFTLSFSSDFETPVYIGDFFIDEIICSELSLWNSGQFPLEIERAYFLKNSEFSITPSSLPLEIPPNSKIDLEYCFNPLSAGIIDDTLIIEYEVYCVSLKIPFVGKGKQIELNATSNCNAEITSQIGLKKNQSLIVNIFPIPVGDLLFIDFSSQGASYALFQVYDLLGNLVFDKTKELKEGQLIEIDFCHLPNGFYYLIIYTDKGTEKFHFQKY